MSNFLVQDLQIIKIKINCHPSYKSRAGKQTKDSRMYAAAKKTLIVLVTCAAGLSTGCQSPPAWKSLRTEDPIKRVNAIQQAAKENKRNEIPELIFLLDDEEPVVRMYAIHALREMTGEDFGYRYFDSESERAKAIEKWRQWLANSGGASAEKT
jgi:hypothetical protein